MRLDDGYKRTSAKEGREAAPAPTVRAGRMLRVEGAAQLPVIEGGPAKPPYRVPGMAEVAAVPWNGLVAASLFAGCGGSSLGWRMAGYQVRYALDSDPDARASYAPNMAPGTVLDGRDVRMVRGAEILDACGGVLDVLDGSPPCVSFSTAGRRAAGWGKKRAHAGLVQTQDDLFLEFLRLVGEARPRAFVAENVSGMAKGVAKGYFLDVLEGAKRLGYRTRCKLLDAQWLGVPQARQRVIFVGLRADLFPGAEPPFPRPLPYRYSLREACPWIVGATTRTGSQFTYEGLLADRPMRTVRAGDPSQVVEARQIVGNDAFEPRFGSIDGPHPTIMAQGPTERRKFTIAELKRVCAFPDDFELRGTYAQQWARLGNSVPPLMMRAVASALAPALLAGGAG